MPETIGVISDIHGLLRQDAVDALQGCDRIIHAGDVGSADVLEQLRRLAPVVAVRGNVDNGGWAQALPRSAAIELDGHTIYVLHILADLDLASAQLRRGLAVALAKADLQPAPAGVSAVVYGHSHKPSIEDRDSVLYLNPGSAGPRRFRLPVSVARLSVVDGRLTARIIELDVARSLSR